ncbi:hypothetical protein NQ036_03820 [Brevibacterium sp. 91QC2O2]|uniref:hypothetical protein n=1 Tax=Brevibacterium TaxID=1696 RepID=UPI00211C553A|nr:MULTISPECIES: hypothetical protein [unclassified Brevibacterium]MCQ9367375.1 hypothetical protein [Brevibacterium sp. 91QC2O2]MCQ9384612.1 hypothetical protein [Brevibacterium sp. 68QC2CO]
MTPRITIRRARPGQWEARHDTAGTIALTITHQAALAAVDVWTWGRPEYRADRQPRMIRWHRNDPCQVRPILDERILALPSEDAPDTTVYVTPTKVAPCFGVATFQAIGSLRNLFMPPLTQDDVALVPPMEAPC